MAQKVMKRRRARSSGIVLNQNDARVVKGMLARGDRQQDIGSWFGVNPGRVSAIKNGQDFWWVDVAPEEELPPPGPYHPGVLFAQIIALTKALKAANDN